MTNVPKKKIDLGKLLVMFNNIINSFNYDILTKKQIALHLCSDILSNKVELLSHYEFILLYNEFEQILAGFQEADYTFSDPELSNLIKLFSGNTEYKKILLAVELFDQTSFDLPPQKVEIDYKENYYKKVYGVKYAVPAMPEPRFYVKTKENLLKLIEEVVKLGIQPGATPDATPDAKAEEKELKEVKEIKEVKEVKPSTNPGATSEDAKAIQVVNLDAIAENKTDEIVAATTSAIAALNTNLEAKEVEGANPIANQDEVNAAQIAAVTTSAIATIDQAAIDQAAIDQAAID
jgi:hypothetical protein